MYDFLRGKIATNTPTRIVLDVGGIGFALDVPLSTSEALPRKGEAEVYVQLHVREDVMRLFGFATTRERELFNILQRVNGIGPTLALAIVSRAKVEDIARAIADGRVDFLKSLKGVGPKTAQRLITELQDKVVHLAAGTSPADIAAGIPVNNIELDAVQALEVLGCPPKSATTAVRKVLKKEPSPSLENLVRDALKIIWPA